MATDEANHAIYTTFNHRDLFTIARAARDSSEGVPHQAIVSIVFAAAGVESLVNDIAESADRERTIVYPVPDPRLGMLAIMLEAAEKARVQIIQKLDLIRTVFMNRAYEPGAAPLQEFAPVIRLRNFILHLRPDVWSAEDGSNAVTREGRGPKEIHSLLRSLTDKKLIENPFAKPEEAWLSSISTSLVSRWAYNSSILMATDLLRVVEASGLATFADWKRGLELLS